MSILPSRGVNLALAGVAAGLGLTLAMQLSGARGGPPEPPMAWLESVAAAGVVTQTGGYTALTAETGSEEVLLVLDGNREQLLVYRVDGMSSVVLMQRLGLPGVFSDARAKILGR